MAIRGLIVVALLIAAQVAAAQSTHEQPAAADENVQAAIRDLDRLSGKLGIRAICITGLDRNRAADHQAGARQATIGVNIRSSGLVVASLASVERLTETRVLLDDKRDLSPKAILLFPELGDAAIALDSESGIPIAGDAEVKVGDPVRVVSMPPGSTSASVLNGFVSTVEGLPKVSRIGIDFAVGFPVEEGVAFNTKGQWVGIISKRENGRARTFAVSAATIKSALARWSDKASRNTKD